MMAEKCKQDTIFKLRNIVGAFLVFLHAGPYSYWGNLSIYVISYIHRMGSPEEQVHQTLMLALYSTSWIVAMLASGFLANRINVRVLLGFAIILQNCSFLVSYFVLDISLMAFSITFGLLVGLGTGLFEGPLLQYYVVNLSQQHSGLLTAVAMAGGASGSVIISQFATWYTNPKNLPPDSSIIEMQLFTQEEILNKVPPMFLILGGTMFTFQMIGIFLLKDASPSDKENRTLHTTYSSTKQELTVVRKQNMAEGEAGVENSSSSLLTDDRFGRNYTPRELIRCVLFYKLFAIYVFGISGRVVVGTYYKVYGQKWIADDHFLTYLGTTQTLCAIPSTVVWGLAMDNIGMKLSLMISYGGMTVFALLMYFTAPWNQWAYSIAFVCTACVTNVYPCFNIATVKWFGSKHLAANLALLEIGASFGYLVSALILDTLIERFGHFSEFSWMASMCCFGFVFITLFLPGQ